MPKTNTYLALGAVFILFIIGFIIMGSPAPIIAAKAIFYDDIYKDLYQSCRQNGTYCCFLSVDIMEKNQYLLPDPACTPGNVINSLRCEDSYSWCEPLPLS